MTEKTWKQIDLDQHAITLLVNPGTSAQRALWTAQDNRPAQMAHAIAKARGKYPSAPLAWLKGQTIIPVIP